MKNSILFKLITWLLGLAVSVVLFFAGAYVFLKVKYDVDFFATVKQVKVLTETPDESVLVTNPFADENMQSAMVTINASVPNLVKYSTETGYDISGDDVTATEMSQTIRLADVECGAVLNSMIAKNAENNKIKIGSAELPFQFVELDFSDLNVTEKTVSFTSILKLDARNLKESMSSFPASLFKKYIPDYFFVSTTTTVTKTETAFEYTVSNAKVKINNLTTEETMSLLETLNKLLSFGNPETLANSFAEPMVNALIGTSETNGFVYVLKNSFSASDWAFVLDGEKIYFEVYA